MKALSLSLLLLFAGSVAVEATPIEIVTIDLSPFHAGSELTGSVSLTAPLTAGDSVPIDFTFSDPADYSAGPLSGMLTIGNGIGGNTVRFSALTFTNLANNSTINLTVRVAALCTASTSTPDGFPCEADGQWQDGDPAKFTGAYSVSAMNSVPEPGYSVPLLFACAGLALRRLKRS
jgi:hypothetical protein